MNGESLNVSDFRKGFLAGSVPGLAIGFGIGCLVARVLAKRHMERRISAEVQSVKDHYRARANVAGKGDNPGDRIPSLGASRMGRTGTVASLAAEPDPGRHPGSQTDPADSGHDPGIGENPEPGEDEPHIITEQEYGDEEGRNLLKVRWYEGDEVLADERDVPIRDVRSTVGEEFRFNFGTGSDSPHTVYIRNDHLGADIEVVRDGRSFSEAVLGYGKPP